MSGEIENPRQIIPRVLNSAMALVVGSFVLANIAYLAVLPLDSLRDTDTIAMVSGPAFGSALEGRATDSDRTLASNFLVVQARSILTGL